MIDDKNMARWPLDEEVVEVFAAADGSSPAHRRIDGSPGGARQNLHGWRMTSCQWRRSQWP
jgi:hypothetical protein